MALDGHYVASMEGQDRLVLYELGADDAVIVHIDIHLTEVYVGYAAITFVTTDSSTTPTVRVAIASQQGIFLYEAASVAARFVCKLVWTHESPDPTRFTHLAFGQSPAYLSWFRIPDVRERKTMLEGAWIPVAAEGDDNIVTTPGSLPRFSFFDADGPALYCAGLGDLDETRGIAVLGSAFGELVMYDFSGADPKALEECYTPLEYCGGASESSLPTVRISLTVSLEQAADQHVRRQFRRGQSYRFHTVALSLTRATDARRLSRNGVRTSLILHHQDGPRTLAASVPTI